MYICLHTCTHTHIHTPPLSLEDKKQRIHGPTSKSKENITIIFRSFKIYSLSNFQTCNPVLLVIVTVLHIARRDLFLLYLEGCDF